MQSDFNPAAERGQVPTPPKPPEKAGLPRGDGMVPVPYHDQFQAQLNTNSHMYWSLFDEALQSSRENAYRMTLDPVIGPCREVRAYPTALLPGDVTPDDDENEVEIKAAKRVTQDIRHMTGLAAMRRWLAFDATWKGVSGAQVVFNWVPSKGKLRQRPVSWLPIDGDSLHFGWGGEVAIKIRGGAFSGPQVVPTESGMCYKLTPEQRENVLIHRYNPAAADYWKPQNARTVIGSGLRGPLYWLWGLKSQIWQMGIDWIRWFSRGFTVYYYEDGNHAHLLQIQAAIKAADGSYAMTYPLPKGRVSDSPYFVKPFEQIMPSAANADFIIKLITEYLDDLIRFAILHQSSTTQVGPSGLNSGAMAASHQTTFDNLIKMDALQLDDTFTSDLVRQLYRVNEPGITPGRWVSQIDSPNVEQLMNSAQTIVGLGGSVALKPLTEAAGIPDPKDGETTLGGMQPGQPAAVTGIPDGVPMVGANPTGLQPAA